jgi:hypothetical protein
LEAGLASSTRVLDHGVPEKTMESEPDADAVLKAFHDLLVDIPYVQGIDVATNKIGGLETYAWEWHAAPTTLNDDPAIVVAVIDAKNSSNDPAIGAKNENDDQEIVVAESDVNSKSDDPAIVVPASAVKNGSDVQVIVEEAIVAMTSNVCLEVATFRDLAHRS